MGGEDQKPTASDKAPAWENSNHHLHIHHSDQPGAILVPQLLAEDNFSTWIDSMNAALQIKNKIGFVDGTLPRPKKNPDEQNQWNRCDILVKTWLKASMSKEIGKSFSHCKDSRTIWLELHERFGQTNTVHLFHLENLIHDCQQGSQTVTAFFTQLKTLWDEKEVLCNIPDCTCEAGDELEKYVETQKIMKFLMGLSDEFATTRSNIIAMDPLPSLNKVFSICIRHEKQVAVAANKSTMHPSEATAFHVQQQHRDDSLSESFAGHTRKAGRGSSNNDSRPRCTKCDRFNHTTENCRAHLRCSTCGYKGHTADNCKAHLRCTICNFRGHVVEECNKKKRFMQSGEGSSRVNHISAHCTNQDQSVKSSLRAQLLELLQEDQSFSQPSMNPNGKITNYEELSGPTIGEDDWDRN